MSGLGPGHPRRGEVSVWRGWPGPAMTRKGLFAFDFRSKLFGPPIGVYKPPDDSEASVNRRPPLALAFLLVLATPAAAQHWAFCVGWAPGVKDVWISDVFPAGLDRERLEAGYKNFLERQGAAGAVAQCPQPSEDKTGVVNAQTEAEDFNRKLGAILHSVPAQEFPPRR
jgi:hypothetical protein